MILAIESSCDETALAVVDSLGVVKLNYCLSQIALHKKYGGVVPELASRSHFESLEDFSKVIRQSGLSENEITAVAATMGPGLVGPLLVGSSFARGLAAAWGKKFIGVHHLRAHVASVLLGDKDHSKNLKQRADELFPAIVLLVSGGHCMILKVEADLTCEILKSTSDDAAGECFDKCAKLIGLGYPGGPAIQAESQKCLTQQQLALAKEWSDKLPRPKSEAGFSFAGLKTAFRLLVEQDSRTLENIPSLARALEQTISDTLLGVLAQVASNVSVRNLICCGGVSANIFLRANLESWCQKNKWFFHCAPLEYSTDNAAMIAVAAWLQGDKHSKNSVFARGQL